MVQLTPRQSLRSRLNLSRLAIQYPWFTLGFWIAVMVAGLLAFSSLKYALFPDLTFPVVVVNATARLTTAPDTVTKLTEPIEQTLHFLKNHGLEEMKSSTYPGQAILRLSFAAGASLEQSANQVQTAISKAALPSGSMYQVTPINLNESSAISYVIGSSNYPLPKLVELAQAEIVPAIAHISGVLQVKLLGVPVGIAANSSIPQKGAKTIVQPPGASAVRFNRQDGLAVDVIKRRDANTLEVVQAVETVVQQLQAKQPNVQLSLAATQAGFIRESTQATLEALALAIALSVLVIFSFLWNWKATLISALAIPTSLLGTFIVMAICGFRLETITLLALALVIGIIVDDAIVDVENIARHIEAGEPPKQAAINATNEIGLTVTAATFAIVAVFLPVGFIQGVLGQFFRPFGITVSAAVIISLLVARTLSPLLAAQWLRATPSHSSQGFGFTLLPVYRWLLGWALKHRAIVVGVALVSFIAGMALIPFVPKGFIPRIDHGEFTITYTTPLSVSKLVSGAVTSDVNLTPSSTPPALPLNPLAESLAVAKTLEAFAFQSPEVQSVFTTIGQDGQPKKGTLYVALRPDRVTSTAALEDQFRRQRPTIPQVAINIEDLPIIAAPGEKPLQVALVGNDLNNLAALRQTAEAVKQRLDGLAGFSDVTVSGVASKDNKLMELSRLNSRLVVYINADLEQGFALGAATDQVVKLANALKPATVSVELGGDSAKMVEVFSNFGATLGLSVLCILLVLALLFRSNTDPLVILFSLPLSIIGALMAVLLTHSDFGIISVIGIVFLLGLTNKNAILLVDYIKQLRRTGLSCTEAILQAAPIRLRPILMTTTAMILGMMPIALGLGAGAELRAPMAIAIVGGLVTSTLLSLLVVPVVYALIND